MTPLTHVLTQQVGARWRAISALTHRLQAGSYLSLFAALAVFSHAADMPTGHPPTTKISANDLQFFETKIRPLLADKCFKCHSKEGDKVKGGLLLDSRESVLHGGNTGPALVPGNPDKSLLIQAVRYKDEDLQMPPKGEKLSDQQIADLTEWVRRGAPDPRTNVSKGSNAAYAGVGTWNSYDITFRAARFKDGKLIEKPLVSMFFNGQKVHTNVPINQIWGGANSGLDGGKDGGTGFTDTPGGLKLQCEGHDVRYRNAWIKELDLEKPDTDFKE